MLRKAIVLLFVLLPIYSFADVIFKNTIVDFVNPNHVTESLTLKNMGKKTAHIEMMVLPKDKSEREKAKTQGVDPRQLGVIVSPVRLSIKPNAEKNVRVTILKPRKSIEKDEVFLLVAKPVDKFKVKKPGELEETSGALKVRLIYTADLRVRPYKMFPSLEAKRSADQKQVVVKNTGNTYLRLLRWEGCRTTGCEILKNDGGKALSVGVKPGSLKTVAVPSNAKNIKFKMFFGKKSRALTVS